jgi:dolichyl-phosphate-mannose--protein O-mannosyl transferase
MTDPPRQSDGRRQFALVLLSLAILLGIGLRVHGIGRQPPIRDETMSAFTALNYVEHGLFGPTMPFHPNLRNLVLYASTEAFSTGVAGMRGPSLIMGMLSIPLLALLVLRLTRDRVAAGLAGLFLAIDPVHVTFSRQSIQEVYTTFLFLLGTYPFVLSFDDERRLERSWMIPVAGVAFGLSVASKHHGIFPLLVCLAVGLYLTLRRSDRSAAVFCGLSLTLLPLTVYLLTYYPWFLRGYDLAEWVGSQQALLGEMVEHVGYATSSTIDDRPWQWFIKPLMGYGNFAFIEGRPFVTVAMGNPLVWMLVLPSTIWLILRDRANTGVALLLTLFWVAYLPLVLSPRPIWLLSSLAVTPFAFGLVGRFLSRVLVDGGRRRWLVLLLAGAVVVSLLLYPMAAGRAWEIGYLRPLVAPFNPHR